MAQNNDRAFKDLSEQDRRGLLHLFGSLPLRAKAEVGLLERETSLPALRTDQVFQISEGGSVRLEHYECLTHYRSTIGERIGRYGMGLALSKSLPVYSTLILLNPNGTPAVVAPEEVRLAYGGVEVRCRYRVIKVWEMDPAVALATGRPELLAWVPLMRCDQKSLAAAAAKLRKSRNMGAATRFVLLGSSRYNRDELARLLGRLGEMIPLKFYEQSWIVQDFKKAARTEGFEQGREEGREEGRLEVLRTSLLKYVSARFPKLRDGSVIAGATDIGALESLRDELFAAPTADEARRALDGFRAATTGKRRKRGKSAPR